jgi:hypothetical protein
MILGLCDSANVEDERTNPKASGKAVTARAILPKRLMNFLLFPLTGGSLISLIPLINTRLRLSLHRNLGR